MPRSSPIVIIEVFVVVEVAANLTHIVFLLPNVNGSLSTVI